LQTNAIGLWGFYLISLFLGGVAMTSIIHNIMEEGRRDFYEQHSMAPDQGHSYEHFREGVRLT